MNLEVIFFAITYALIFTGYYVTNGFLNILYPDEAFIGFAIFYGFYAVGSLIAPFIISKISMKLTLCLSSFTYIIYVGFTSSKISTLMLIGSAICGSGNALIWLAQGAWMKTFVDDDKGKLIGLFFGIFNFNILVGNLIALLVLISNVSVQFMIWIMLILTGIGFIMTIFIPPLTKNFLKNIFSPNKNDVPVSFFKTLKDVFTIIIINKGFLLIPLYFLQAVDLNISYQTATRRLIANSNFTDPSYVTSDVNIYNAGMYLAYGLSSVIFGILSGKIINTKPQRYIIIPYIIFEFLGLIGIMLLARLFSDGPLGLWVIIGFIKGISDNFLNTLITFVILNIYKKDSNLMFALYRFVYAISYVIISIIVGFSSYEYILGICSISVIISMICYYFFHKYNNSNLDNQFTNSSVIINTLV